VEMVLSTLELQVWLQ